MFLSVIYGQLPSPCAPANLPSPSETPPRWSSSLSPPPHCYKQKLYKATRLGHSKLRHQHITWLLFLHHFPHYQDRSNHHHWRHLSEGTLSIQGQTSLRVPVPASPVRPRIPGALLPPGAAPPAHGPGPRTRWEWPAGPRVQPHSTLGCGSWQPRSSRRSGVHPRPARRRPPLPHAPPGNSSSQLPQLLLLLQSNDENKESY